MGLLDVRQVDTYLVSAAGEGMARQPTETFARRGHAVGSQRLVACGRGRPPLCATAMRLRSRGSRPIGATISPCAGDNKPYTNAE